MKLSGLKLVVLALLLSFVSSCAYYNTFFNAKRYYNDAEKQRLKRLEDMTKRRGSSQQRSANPNKPSSLELQNYDKSIEKASKVLEFYPNSKYVDDALFLLGQCFYRKEEYNKAQRKFLELIQNFPNSEFFAASKLWYGKTNIELQEYDAAEKNFHDILNSKATDEIRDEAQFLLGGLFKHKKDYVTAISEYQTAARRTRDKTLRAKAYYEMGECHFLLKNFASAVESYKQARKYSPDSKFEFNAMFRAGLALKEMKSFDDAIKIFNNLLGDVVNEENWPVCRLEIGHCYRLKGEFDHAIEWYLDIISRHPKTEEAATAYYFLGKIYQDRDGNYEQAKEFFDKAILENASAEIIPEARTISKNIQQMLSLRATILAQQKSMARGDSIAAILDKYDLNSEELPKLSHTKLDTLVATALFIPLDSLTVAQHKLIPIYEKYYGKHYDRFGEKIFTTDPLNPKRKPVVEPTLLDSLVAQSLRIPLNYLQSYVADSLYPMYDRYYAQYTKNKLLYEQFYQSKGATGKTEQQGTAFQELVKAKLALAELYLFEFSQPDSALKEYIDILEMDTSRQVIPRTLFSIGYICEKFKQDTLLADSVYQRLIAQYPDDPLAQKARKKIKTISIVDPNAALATKYALAEQAYLDRRQYQEALDTFQSIYEQAPGSEYAPKALMAMGYIYEHDIQHFDKAFEIYQHLVSDYPTSPYAKRVKPKVDEVIKSRTSSSQIKKDESVVDASALAKKATSDSTQLADSALSDREQYRRLLRQEMEKNDPRRKSPRRW
ncbi:MAG: tetratricopeptide repeat protein [candidate division KSB1 bacterium]|nr:tetratricopeptide repeat protein [candidate division KSB1 bacterium]